MAAPDRRTDSRHMPTSRIDITCTPARRTTWFRRKPSPVAVTVLEASANGMLIDVPLELKAALGDIVALSSGANNDAVARVVHTVRDENWANQWFGVEITEMSPEFAASLNLLVASLGVDKVFRSPRMAQTVGSMPTSIGSRLSERRRSG